MDLKIAKSIFVLLIISSDAILICKEGCVVCVCEGVERDNRRVGGWRCCYCSLSVLSNHVWCVLFCWDIRKYNLVFMLCGHIFLKTGFQPLRIN